MSFFTLQKTQARRTFPPLPLCSCCLKATADSFWAYAQVRSTGGPPPESGSTTCFSSLGNPALTSNRSSFRWAVVVRCPRAGRRCHPVKCALLDAYMFYRQVIFLHPHCTVMRPRKRGRGGHGPKRHRLRTAVKGRWCPCDLQDLYTAQGCHSKADGSATGCSCLRLSAL